MNFILDILDKIRLELRAVEVVLDDQPKMFFFFHSLIQKGIGLDLMEKFLSLDRVQGIIQIE